MSGDLRNTAAAAGGTDDVRKPSRRPDGQPRDELGGYLREHVFGLLAVLRFLPQRIRYARAERVRPAPTPDIRPVLDRLQRDGVVVVPDFIGPEMISRMKAAVPPFEEFEESPEGERSYFYRDADRLPELAPFFGSPFLRGLAQSYISDRATQLRRTIGLKVVQGPIPSFESSFHMDTWKQRLKFFLYLEDVGPDEAPMVYLRGSHRGWWRLTTEARIAKYYRTDPQGYAGEQDRFFLGTFWPHEVAQLRNDYGYEDVVCTGSAGTLVAFDGRGLHRATPLGGTRRLILTSYWIHAGDHT